MPYRAKKLCNTPGCTNLCNSRMCDSCKGIRQRKQDQVRGTAHQRGYNARWRRARTHYLLRNPICVECLKKDRVSASTVVDHIIPHEGDMILFWNRSNWQALCKTCHDIKTAIEDGAFGREKKDHKG